MGLQAHEVVFPAIQETISIAVDSRMAGKEVCFVRYI